MFGQDKRKQPELLRAPIAAATLDLVPDPHRATALVLRPMPRRLVRALLRSFNVKPKVPGNSWGAQAWYDAADIRHVRDSLDKLVASGIAATRNEAAWAMLAQQRRAA